MFTVDNHFVTTGDVVWTFKKGQWERHIVKSAHRFKVEFEEPDSEGYIGARHNLVYKKPRKQEIKNVG